MVIFLLLLLGIPLPQAPSRYVTDHAGVLPFDRVTALETKLLHFEYATSNQVIVYVQPYIPEGTTLEEMSAEAIRTWGVGQKGKDNGVILFVFTESRKVRIEVGYGLEGTLTDAKSKLIISEVMLPHLRDGDYIGAVEQGTEAIVGVIAPGYAFTAPEPPPAPAPVSSTEVLRSLDEGIEPFETGKFMIFVLAFIAFMIVMIKKYGGPNAVPVGFVGFDDPRQPPQPSTLFDSSRDSWTASSSGSSSSSHSSSSWSGWSSGGSSSSSWGSSSSGSSSSSSSSGSSGGGFTGGGGSGGGGGASGSW